MFKPKVIVILGQTSSGKSDLAVKIALRLRSGSTTQKYGGEVISADSRQVYKGLDLGTGKITRKEMQGVPHFLLDVANPKKSARLGGGFSVTEYKKLVDKKIKEIIARGNVPIICGGTGFYIDAVVNGIIFPEVPPNEKLRKNLNKKNTEELFKILQKLDKNRAKNIKEKNELNNKVRLIRAIEVAKTLGKIPKVSVSKPEYDFLKIGLYLPSDILKEKINKRLLARIKMGMINEIKNLHKKGLSWKRMEEMGLEYRYISFYLQNKISKEEMLKKLNSEIYKYAKRQMTWFKRDKEIKWFDASKKILLNSLINP